VTRAKRINDPALHGLCRSWRENIRCLLVEPTLEFPGGGARFDTILMPGVLNGPVDYE
jgi:hypothetical protein